MPNIFREVSVPAGATNENIWAGSAYEFAPTNQVVSIGLAAAATGTFATVQSGGVAIAEEFSPPVLTRYPIIPDEMYLNFVQVQGERNILRWRNPTGGAVVVRGVLSGSPIR